MKAIIANAVLIFFFFVFLSGIIIKSYLSKKAQKRYEREHKKGLQEQRDGVLPNLNPPEQTQQQILEQKMFGTEMDQLEAKVKPILTFCCAIYPGFEIDEHS